MARCAYFKLPGECTTTSSFPFPSLCSGHASHCYGIGQIRFSLSAPVSRSISKFSPSDSLGILLIAEWTGLEPCDDIVFNENDTVIPFSEYKDAAFNQCQWQNHQNDDIVELAKQRHFSQVLAGSRMALKCAGCFSRHFKNHRKDLINVSAQTFLVANELAAKQGYKFDLETLMANKPLFVTETFRLSKPLYAYMRKLHSLSNESAYQPLPWDIMSSLNCKSSLQGAAEMEFFRHHNAVNFISGEFKKICMNDHPTEASIISSKITQYENEIYIRFVSKESVFRRLLRRPLINQYDDSILGACHRYFLSSFPEIYSARVLNVISMLCLPISTIKRPMGTLQIKSYLEYFCDPRIYSQNKNHGVGKDPTAVIYPHAFAIFDGFIDKDSDAATDVGFQELQLAYEAIKAARTQP